jgi:mannose-1-phosphate guanylyltransferase
MRRLIKAAPIGAPVCNNVGGVILCAGKGIRMEALTQLYPKPLVPILNCPLLWWKLVRIRREVRRVALNVHYLHEVFAPLPEIGKESAMDVSLVYEKVLTGPVGGVLACRRALSNAADILVLAGDGLYEADFSGILQRHREQDAELTIGVASVDDGSRYGVVTTDSSGRVVHMLEKPVGVGPVQEASCGVYVVSNRLFSRFSAAGGVLDWVHVVHTLLNEGVIVAAAKVNEWHDVGTPADFLRVNLQLLASDRISLVARKFDTPGGQYGYKGNTVQTSLERE